MRRLLASLAILLSLVLLASCGSTRVMREGTYARHGTSSPKHGATTIVQRGDTLYGIAFRNGLDFRDVAAWNGIRPPYTIYPGQRLHLYPAGGAQRRETVASTPSRTTQPRTTQPRPTAGGTPSTTAHATPRPATPPPAPASSGIAWRWPAEGQLVARFEAGEPTRQGIDIAGSAGDPVRAAADGVVVYSGSGLVGYGELVIVKHNDAWLSAYGHNRARKVNEGQLVKAGDQIAEMGRSGASRDMLHFEVRHNGKPVDPMRYLPPR
ncbi:peptidoglycan DD-metalloendopeptidase family protein [Luteimonas pelagia]